MRVNALAAMAAVLGLAVAGSAEARTWSAPDGRFSFDAPSGWVMQVSHSGADGTIVLAGSANDECYLMALVNANTASATADAARRTVQPLTPAAWSALANAITPMFPGNSAQVTTQSVDTDGFWPVQRAQFSGAARPVVGALTSRPGLDFVSLCWTYDGPDASATYRAVFDSMASANEQTWRSQAESQAAARAATQAAQAAAAAAAAQQHAQHPQTGGHQ
jgi:hypothetical protein